MWSPHRVGVGLIDGSSPALAVLDRSSQTLALFVPSDQPAVTVFPPGRDHVALAVGWMLRTCGLGHLGGRLVLVSESSTQDWTDCLTAVMAVDDAAAGGHRPADTRGSELLDRILRDPHELAAAVDL